MLLPLPVECWGTGAPLHAQSDTLNIDVSVGAELALKRGGSRSLVSVPLNAPGLAACELLLCL